MASVSLDAVLAKRRLHGGDRNVVVVHGVCARDSPWLPLFIAAKCGRDKAVAIAVTDRVAGGVAVAEPAVGFWHLTGPPCLDVLPPHDDGDVTGDGRGTGLGADVLATVSRRIAKCLHSRAAAYAHGHDPATLPPTHVPIIIDACATLLLSSTIDAFTRFVDELPVASALPTAVCSPVIVVYDATVCGTATLHALTAVANVVIRCDALPVPSKGGMGTTTYHHGHLVVTEFTSAGKDRSFVQEYSVSPAGTVAMTTASPTAHNAALAPVPPAPLASWPAATPSAPAPAPAPAPPPPPLPSASAVPTTTIINDLLAALPASTSTTGQSGTEGNPPGQVTVHGKPSHAAAAAVIVGGPVSAAADLDGVTRDDDVDGDVDI